MAKTIQSSKKNLAKSSSRSSSSRSKSSSRYSVSKSSKSSKSSRPSAEEVVNNIKLVNNQGPGLSAYVIDGLTGKKYNKAEDILKAYGIGYE